MGHAWRALSLIVCVSALPVACDPAAFMRIRQPATPVGLVDCLQSALDRSELVVSVQRPDSSPRFRVSIRDPSPWARTAVVSLKRDGEIATALEVEYVWIPNAGGPTLLEQRHMADVGAALAEEMRRQCFPDIPSETSCVTSRLFSSKPCASKGTSLDG